MLPPGKSVPGRCGFGVSHLGIHFFDALRLTAWGGPGLWSVLPAPRTSDGDVVWYSGQGAGCQLLGLSGARAGVQSCRASAVPSLARYALQNRCLKPLLNRSDDATIFLSVRMGSNCGISDTTWRQLLIKADTSLFFIFKTEE